MWSVFDRVLSWSPYYGLEDDDEPVFYPPREAAEWIREIADALPFIDA
jgi:hypothetical protein